MGFFGQVLLCGLATFPVPAVMSSAKLDRGDRVQLDKEILILTFFLFKLNGNLILAY